MAFPWRWIWITLLSIHNCGVSCDRSKVCKYARYILKMDCTDVELEGLHDNMYPINSPSLSVLILQNTGLTTLEPNVFSHLTKLTRLDLSRNHLHNLDNRLFVNLTELWTLDITNNRLISLTDERLFASQLKLKYLKLSNNSLIFLGKGVLSPLVSLKYLYLSGNPFVCDCQLRDAMLWCEDRNLSTNAVCHYPNTYNGSSWQTLSDPEICSKTTIHSNVTSVIVGIGVIVMILFVLLAVWWFCWKPGKPRCQSSARDGLNNCKS
jgi:cbb3-type cytochrome oxidase subunit 3